MKHISNTACMYCYWTSSSEILILCQTSHCLHRLTEQVSTVGGREREREWKSEGRERRIRGLRNGPVKGEGERKGKRELKNERRQIMK